MDEKVLYLSRCEPVGLYRPIQGTISHVHKLSSDQTQAWAAHEHMAVPGSLDEAVAETGAVMPWLSRQHHTQEGYVYWYVGRHNWSTFQSARCAAAVRCLGKHA